MDNNRHQPLPSSGLPWFFGTVYKTGCSEASFIFK